MFASPTPYERFGLSILVVLASDYAVVANDTCDVRGYLVDGENDITLQPRDRPVLAEAINAFLVNPDRRSRLARRRRETAMEYSMAAINEWDACEIERRR